MIATWLGIVAYLGGAIITAYLFVKWERIDTDNFGDMGVVMLVAIFWIVFFPVTMCVGIARMIKKDYC